MQEKITALPPVKNMSTKEAFYYQAIRAQAINEFLVKPDELIEGIERAKTARK